MLGPLAARERPREAPRAAVAASAGPGAPAAVPAEAEVAHGALGDGVGQDQHDQREQAVEAADPLVGVGEAELDACRSPRARSAGAISPQRFQ